MLSKGPHISIEAASLVPRILHIDEREFSGWPEAVRHHVNAIMEGSA